LNVWNLNAHTRIFEYVFVVVMCDYLLCEIFLRIQKLRDCRDTTCQHFRQKYIAPSPQLWQRLVTTYYFPVWLFRQYTMHSAHWPPFVFPYFMYSTTTTYLYSFVYFRSYRLFVSWLVGIIDIHINYNYCGTIDRDCSVVSCY